MGTIVLLEGKTEREVLEKALGIAISRNTMKNLLGGKWSYVDFTGKVNVIAVQLEMEKIRSVIEGALEGVIKVEGGEQKVAKMLVYMPKVLCPSGGKGNVDIVALVDADKLKIVLEGLVVDEREEFDGFKLYTCKFNVKGCENVNIYLVVSVPNLEELLKRKGEEPVIDEMREILKGLVFLPHPQV